MGLIGKDRSAEERTGGEGEEGGGLGVCFWGGREVTGEWLRLRLEGGGWEEEIVVVAGENIRVSSMNMRRVMMENRIRN